MAQSDKGFLFFFDWLEPFEILDGEEFKKIFFSMLRYQRDGTPPPEFDGAAKIVASFVFPQLERRQTKSNAGKFGMDNRWAVNNKTITDCNSVNNKTITLRQDKDKDIDLNVDKDIDKDKIILPFADGALSVGSAKQKEYTLKYPHIDILGELEKMQSYLSTANHNKTLKDAARFISGWLKGENEKAKQTLSESSQNASEKSHDADEFFKAAVRKSMGKIT